MHSEGCLPGRISTRGIAAAVFLLGKVRAPLVWGMAAPTVYAVEQQVSMAGPVVSFVKRVRPWLPVPPGTAFCLSDTG